MAFQIRSGQKKRLADKLISIPVLVLALMVQPVYGLVAGQATVAAAEHALQGSAPLISELSVVVSDDGNTVRLDGSVTDADDDLKDYNVRVYTAPYESQVAPWRGHTGTSVVINGPLATFDVSDLQEGTYYLRIWADDVAGNRQGVQSHIYVPFTIDRSPAVEEEEDEEEVEEEGEGPISPVIPVDPIIPIGNGEPEVPVLPEDEEDEADITETDGFIAFLPATFGGMNMGGTAATPSPITATPIVDSDDDTGVLGDQDVRTSWSVINAALAGFIAVLAVVALAGIRRGQADNNTGARLFMIVPAVAAVMAFLVAEDIGGSMIWFNAWTWLFAGILAAQAIVATLTTKTAND